MKKKNFILGDIIKFILPRVIFYLLRKEGVLDVLFDFLKDLFFL